MVSPGDVRKSEPAVGNPKRFLKARIDPQGLNKEPFWLARPGIPVSIDTLGRYPKAEQQTLTTFGDNVLSDLRFLLVLGTRN